MDPIRWSYWIGLRHPVHRRFEAPQNSQDYLFRAAGCEQRVSKEWGAISNHRQRLLWK
jgi:hypothetical protein